MNNSSIEIYRSPEGTVELDVKLENETVWLNANQMAILFDRDEKTIRKHINVAAIIRNIFKVLIFLHSY